MVFIKNNSRKFLSMGLYTFIVFSTFAKEHGLPIKETFNIGIEITQFASRFILVFLLIGAVFAFYKGSKVVGSLFGIIIFVIVITGVANIKTLFNIDKVGMEFVKMEIIKKEL